MWIKLCKPIDAAILIYFRIGAGILMSQELINGLFIGKFQEYTLPKFHFSYMFFEWVGPWPYWGMVLHYTLTIFSGFAVAFNFHYRIFSKLLFAGYLLLFLMAQTEYINHNYLYCLVSFWMMFLPLNKNQSKQPAWMLYLLLFHMALAYFFGGIAKLNSDWLSGTPMDLFLAHRKDYPLGELYTQSWSPYLFSYGGLAFDLLIVPMLLWKRTRMLGLISSIFFHISNIMMFGLATFPWFSMLLTSMFFDPSWPRKIPILRNFMPSDAIRENKFSMALMIKYALGTYILIHLALPFRHHLYPGNPSWTEEGHMFAWRMMLRSKEGSLQYFVKNLGTNETKSINHLEYITPRQYQDIIGKPDLILQMAHKLRDSYQEKWQSKVAVYATSRVSLNGRPRIEMIKQGVDLALEERSIRPYHWILPLREQELTATRD
jgi:vitamin K-dependent gamma-carboxylase